MFLPVFLSVQCLSETGCFCLCFLQCSASVRQVVYVFLPVFLAVQCLRETGSVCVSACVSYNAVSQ